MRVSQRDELAQVREGYDRWAAVYDHDRNPFAEQFPRAEKYVDWPMLVVFELRAS